MLKCKQLKDDEKKSKFLKVAKRTRVGENRVYGRELKMVLELHI